jgi:hypothetical protein
MAEKQERLTTFNINKIAEIMIILNKLIWISLKFSISGDRGNHYAYEPSHR